MTNIGVLPEAVAKDTKKKTQNFKNHIAVREETFKDFRDMKDEPGSDAFLKKLLNLYQKWLRMKKEKTKNEKSQ